MSPTAVLSVEAMRAAEQAAMNAGTSEWELMQRAGKGAARWVMRMAAGRPVIVLCGPGNNGGDGYVIAGCLHARGYKVRVVAPVKPKSETARKARAAFKGEVVGCAALTDPVVVDCLFGYGLSRDVGGDFATLLQELATSDCFRIAIDVPSSVESDTGSVLGPLPQYDLTLALGAWKQAHFLMPAMASMGALRCVPIGLALDDASDRLATAPRLTAPAADSHKYRRGLLAVVAGSMPGAPLLSAEAAMHAGAGYVKLVSDHSHPDAPADMVIEQDLDAVLEDERISAVLTGPGLGRDDEARKRLSRVLGNRHPCVLDADALHLLRPDMLKGIDVTKLCLTPHEGELATLCESFDVTAQSKLDRAKGLHDVTGMTVLAKGPDTVLAAREGMRFFPRGSSWLSVAGSGDVLAGIVASRLAVHSDTMRACEEAVWLHHEAARRAAPAFSASDLACALKPAMASFL
ncbi:NAD(P)H-hydrate dehydratase [Qipengyuania sp. XHP0211]|uniref:NAD(P)H-hydrate dehydratase n=1 Tax=Qipengyuania sp. XHP0211 TaxID=3038079 RepID=UPI00241DB17F|nr:NAD(P)H-hydrate dehydratase [Qipengyuania sp. XHP0211]MDG5751128.1 NAD(P)H-hydrate dehydratase [Qipengyuania sp. XHP0211]